MLVIANETAGARTLLDRLEQRAELKRGPGQDGGLVTVIAPVNRPRGGYVVYEDTRRASATRRLEKTVAALRGAGIAAHGFVVETDPADAVRDALATLEPPPTEIIVSTHPEQRSGWLRRNVVDRMRNAADAVPVEHVVVDLEAERAAEANVLVVANETVLGAPLLERIRERARQSPASFLIVCPQADPSAGRHPEAERRLKRALSILRAEGVDVHGQVAHPDPFSAATEAVRDERTDEIIVSTFSGERTSSWLRGDLVGRLKRESGLPVEHVTVEREREEATA